DGAEIRVQAFADVQVQAVVARLAPRSFVTRPAEVLERVRRRIADPVDLLPVVPTDVADPEVVRPRLDREAKRIAQTVSDDAPGIGVGARPERVVGETGAVRRVHPQDRPAQAN